MLKEILFYNFSVTFSFLLFESANKNIGTVDGGNVKLKNWIFDLVEILPHFDWPVQIKVSKRLSKSCQQNVKIYLKKLA